MGKRLLQRKVAGAAGCSAAAAIWAGYVVWLTRGELYRNWDANAAVSVAFAACRVLFFVILGAVAYAQRGGRAAGEGGYWLLGTQVVCRAVALAGYWRLGSPVLTIVCAFPATGFAAWFFVRLLVERRYVPAAAYFPYLAAQLSFLCLAFIRWSLSMIPQWID